MSGVYTMGISGDTRWLKDDHALENQKHKEGTQMGSQHSKVSPGATGNTFGSSQNTHEAGRGSGLWHDGKHATYAKN